MRLGATKKGVFGATKKGLGETKREALGATKKGVFGATKRGSRGQKGSFSLQNGLRVKGSWLEHPLKFN